MPNSVLEWACTPFTGYLWNVRQDFVQERQFQSCSTTGMKSFQIDSNWDEIQVGIMQINVDIQNGTGMKSYRNQTRSGVVFTDTT